MSNNQFKEMLSLFSSSESNDPKLTCDLCNEYLVNPYGINSDSYIFTCSFKEIDFEVLICMRCMLLNLPGKCLGDNNDFSKTVGKVRMWKLNPEKIMERKKRKERRRAKYEEYCRRTMLGCSCGGSLCRCKEDIPKDIADSIHLFDTMQSAINVIKEKIEEIEEEEKQKQKGSVDKPK